MSSRGSFLRCQTKRTGGNGTVPANQIMQLLKTKIENVDGRRHTISLPTHPVSESVPVRVRKLSDPLWGRFHLSTSTPRPAHSPLSGEAALRSAVAGS